MEFYPLIALANLVVKSYEMFEISAFFVFSFKNFISSHFIEFFVKHWHFLSLPLITSIYQNLIEVHNERKS